MRIYNTLSKSIEEFEPINPDLVGVYTCGPTVYNFPHIGNLRNFVFADLLQRALKLNGFTIKSVQNITDIDDKIINKAKDENVSTSEITQKYTDYFFDDIRKLNIEDKSLFTKATQYIPKMIEFIKVLIDKEFAYVEKDGSVYFDISKFPDYGKLSGVDMSSLKTGTRVLSDEYTKEDVQDFALWKSEEDEKFSYDSPWGKGRPGWHIECSVMSTDSLGDTFDIHLGGIDLIFPHHENEVAQSEAKTGKKFVNYFMHGAHLLVEGKKMSKSLNNFYTLKDVEEKGFDPLALRYLYLQTHYRQEMNFTWESLKAAQNALEKLRGYIKEFEEEGQIVEDFKSKFKSAINDDLNTSEALAITWEMLKSENKDSDKAKTLIYFDQIFGLGLSSFKQKEINIPSDIAELVDQREEARKSGDFDRSDKLREEINKKGFIVEDSDHGPVVKYK